MKVATTSYPIFKISKSYFVVSACVLLTFMYLLFLNPYIDVRGFNAHDPAGYISRAIALWNGKGYGEEFANRFLPVTIQPIGFSLVLAPLVGLFGVHFVLLKLYMVFFAVLFSLALYRFFQYFLSGNEEALLSVLLTIASPVIFGLSHRVLADIPLFLFVVMALVSLDRYLSESTGLFSSQLWVAAITLGIAYLIKQTAIGVVFGGWFLLLHSKYRNMDVLKKLLVYSSICAIPVVAWQIWDSLVPDDLWYWTTPQVRDFIWKNAFDKSYGFISLSEFLMRVRHNIVWGMSNNLAAVLFAPLYFTEGSYLGFFLSAPVIVWLFWHWMKSFRKKPSVLEGFVFFSLGLMLIKYLGMAARYMAVIYPAILVYTFRGFASFPSRLQKHAPRILIILAFLSTFVVAIDQYRNPYGSLTLKDYVAAAKEAKKLLPDESLCAAPLINHWQVLTGHKCFYARADAVLGHLESNPATYVTTLSETAIRNLEPFKDVERDALSQAFELTRIVEQHPDQFEQIYQNRTFAVFKMVKHGR